MRRTLLCLQKVFRNPFPDACHFDTTLSLLKSLGSYLNFRLFLGCPGFVLIENGKHVLFRDAPPLSAPLYLCGIQPVLFHKQPHGG